MSTKLLKFHSKIHSKIPYFSKFAKFQLNLALSIPLITIEIYKIIYVEDHQTKFRTWFCAMLYAAFVHYYIEILLIGVYFVLTNFFLNIKQNYYIFLISSFSKFKSYIYYREMLKKVLEHTKEIKAFNAFYCKYMTSLIFCFSMIGCSVLINSQNSNDVHLILIIPWIFFSILYIFFIWLFTVVSSRTIFLNRKIFLKLLLFQMSLCDVHLTPSRSRIVHLNLVNEYKPLLFSSSFRLATTSPLNNKLFYFQIMGLISGIYMKIL